MACGIPTLLIGARSGAVRLALTPEERPVWPEDLAAGAPALEADERPDFLIEGAALEGVAGLEGAGQVLVNLFVGDEFVAADVFRTDAGWVLRPAAPERPFADVVGIARISILFAAPGGGRMRLHAEPVQVRLPPGPAADNLLAMSRVVTEEGAELFGTDELLFTDEDEAGGLERRLKLLEEAAALYERQYAYFRENARCRLVVAPARRSVEALRQLTPEGARWIATHPDELQAVGPGQGFRAQGRRWMPRHALVLGAEESRGTPENAAVVAFPGFLAGEAGALARRLTALTGGAEGSGGSGGSGRSGGSGFGPAALGAFAVRGRVERLEAAERTLKRLGDLYRRAVGVAPPMLTRLPEATPAFLETAQYRLVYGLMREWFMLEPLDLEHLVRFLAGTRGARLYEYFTLVRLLLDIKRAGFALESREAFSYTGAGPAYQRNALAANFNTFALRRGDERVRVWYQPALYGAHHAPENGLGLMRTSSWSIRTDDAGGAARLERRENVYCSPDFVLAYDRGGASAWAVADSKYSKLSTVAAHYGLEQAFKYLIGLAPVRPGDVFAGLWLFCGSVATDSSAEGSLFDEALRRGLAPAPDLVLTRLNAFNAVEADAGGRVLERLAGALQGREELSG